MNERLIKTSNPRKYDKEIESRSFRIVETGKDVPKRNPHNPNNRPSTYSYKGSAYGIEGKKALRQNAERDKRAGYFRSYKIVKSGDKHILYVKY